jgi:hypothetical protein
MHMALLATQRALLDAVTPELRAVMVNINDEGTSLYMWFYYDGDVPDELITLWDSAVTETSAGLDAIDWIEKKIERLDSPNKIPVHSHLAYLRKGESVAIPEISKQYDPELVPVAQALLCMQRALLAVVTPQLRAVVVDTDKESKQFYIRFYYDKEIDKPLLQLWTYAIMQAHADFGTDWLLDHEVEKIDFPKRMPLRLRLAYHRKEPPFDE